MSIEFFVTPLHHKLDFRVSRSRHFYFQLKFRVSKKIEAQKRCLNRVRSILILRTGSKKLVSKLILSIFYINMHSGKVSVVTKCIL